MSFILDEDVDHENPIEPFQDIAWDFLSTVHPYKTTRAFILNLLQPLAGLYNILKGILQTLLIIPSALLSIVAIISLPFRISSLGIFFMSLTAAEVAFKGLANIVRGVTQLLLTPLTWFLKIPLRAIISLFKSEEPDFPALNSCTVFHVGPVGSGQGDMVYESDVQKYEDKVKSNIHAKKVARGVEPSSNSSACFLFFNSRVINDHKHESQYNNFNP